MATGSVLLNGWAKGIYPQGNVYAKLCFMMKLIYTELIYNFTRILPAIKEPL